jgi:hypothetical protein
MADLLAAALKYAKVGWHVFPCHSIQNGNCTCSNPNCERQGKHPRTKNGLLDATTDEDTIRKWWRKWPNANVAVRTGPESKIWVWDSDMPEGPDETKRLGVPETLIQQTGSGGLHYFFSWNDAEIRNTTRIVAPGIDTRGVNGYALLPPSNHLSGNPYKWVTKKEQLIHAPGWLVDMVVKKDEPESCTNGSSCDPTKYGQTALANEIAKLATAGKGQRNHTLNACAFSLSQLVAGGELSEGQVRAALLSAAISIGLNETEATRTIDSGFKAGSAKPRSVDHTNGNDYQTNQTNRTNQTNPYDGKLTELTGTNPKLTETNRKLTELTGQRGRFNGNLTGSIREFIKEYQGTFTTSDIDREFGLTHQADKNLRKQALLSLVKEKYIKKDPRILGRYHILKSEITFIDFDAADATPFSVNLPLDLSDMVRIPKKSLIVVAGTTNAGKTALAIDIIRRNLDQPYPIMYLMSEMGGGEYKHRIQTAIPEISKWKAKVRAADICSNFDTAIAQHNPNGLTIIDFLEEIQGEYHRIASDIRAIYDALNEGVALICLQKHSKAQVGRGGEATAEKSRLYLTIDKMVHDRESTISALYVYKAKEYIGHNPNGLERHIVFEKSGSQIRPISDWMYCNQVQREKYIQLYEQKVMAGETVVPDDGFGLSIYFTTASGKTVKVNERNLNEWRRAFANITVDAELLKISRDSKERPFLKDKGWFFQVSEILKKKNEGVSSYAR